MFRRLSRCYSRFLRALPFNAEIAGDRHGLGCNRACARQPGGLAVRAVDSPQSDTARWFAAEVQPHEPTLRAWLAQRFQGLAEIDDVVQEACLRVLRARAT